jgi:hypothetical protein
MNQRGDADVSPANHAFREPKGISGDAARIGRQASRRPSGYRATRRGTCQPGITGPPAALFDMPLIIRYLFAAPMDANGIVYVFASK